MINFFGYFSAVHRDAKQVLSERSLRMAKSKQKAAGQFQNLATARYYTHIMSYIEMCYRNGSNVVYALEGLFKGKPLSLTQILDKDADL